MTAEAQQTLRLDKWLWAARFFKTRQLAVEAINGGKIHLNEQRTKPGKEVKIGSKLRIHKGSLEWDIEVLVIPKQRRPASEAIHFYLESDESREQRQKMTELQRLEHAAAPRPDPGRPSKRNRRMIHRFIGKGD
ncbi:MAG: RNA-binding S4 domain-containing protein [Gammaproteobacteria bacterium]|nr:RNA-binding S4 domain-containing protein [Gammaproteobacteria bacterium]